MNRREFSAACMGAIAGSSLMAEESKAEAIPRSAATWKCAALCLPLTSGAGFITASFSSDLGLYFDYSLPAASCRSSGGYGEFARMIATILKKQECSRLLYDPAQSLCLVEDLDESIAGVPVFWTQANVNKMGVKACDPPWLIAKKMVQFYLREKRPDLARSTLLSRHRDLKT